MAICAIYDCESCVIQFADAHRINIQNLITKVKIYGDNNYQRTITAEEYCAYAMLPYKGRLLPKKWAYIYNRKTGKRELCPDGSSAIAITDVFVINQFNQTAERFSYELPKQLWLRIDEKEAIARGWA